MLRSYVELRMLVSENEVLFSSGAMTILFGDFLMGYQVETEN